MSVIYSKHGDIRSNQRGFTKYELELIRQCGTLIDDGDAEVYFVRNKDVENEISRLKKRIQKFEKLRGCKVVCAGNTIITAFRADRSHEKKLLRN